MSGGRVADQHGPARPSGRPGKPPRLRSLVVAAVAVLTVGAGLIGVAVHSYWQSNGYPGDVVTAGTVTQDTTTTYLKSNRRRAYHISFRTRDGVAQETTTKVGGGRPAQAGTPVTVMYDPDRPSRARIRQGTSWGTVLFAGGLGVLILYVGFSTVAFHGRRLARARASALRPGTGRPGVPPDVSSGAN